jgi:hypothetical protein
MAVESISGVVESMARNRKAIKVDGEWYSAFNASQLGGVEWKDEVEFDYEEVIKGGATFLNIKGEVAVLVDGGERDSEPSDNPPSRGRGGAAKGSGRTATAKAPARAGRRAPAESPSPQKAGGYNKDRSIVRQNSLTQANALYATLGRAGLIGEVEQAVAAEELLDLARMFEAYSMMDKD